MNKQAIVFSIVLIFVLAIIIPTSASIHDWSMEDDDAEWNLEKRFFDRPFSFGKRRDLDRPQLYSTRRTKRTLADWF